MRSFFIMIGLVLWASVSQGMEGDKDPCGPYFKALADEAFADAKESRRFPVTIMLEQLTQRLDEEASFALQLRKRWDALVAQSYEANRESVPNDRARWTKANQDAKAAMESLRAKLKTSLSPEEWEKIKHLMERMDPAAWDQKIAENALLHVATQRANDEGPAIIDKALRKEGDTSVGGQTKLATFGAQQRPAPPAAFATADAQKWAAAMFKRLYADPDLDLQTKAILTTYKNLYGSGKVPLPPEVCFAIHDIALRRSVEIDPSEPNLFQAERILGRALSNAEEDGLRVAHRIEMGKGSFTPTGLRQKLETLRKVGFSKGESELLMVEGVAGDKVRKVELNNEYARQLADLGLSDRDKAQIREFRRKIIQEGIAAAEAQSSVHELEGRLAGLMAFEIGGSTSPHRMVYQVEVSEDNETVRVLGVGDHSIYQRVRRKPSK